MLATSMNSQKKLSPNIKVSVLNWIMIWLVFIAWIQSSSMSGVWTTLAAGHLAGHLGCSSGSSRFYQWIHWPHYQFRFYQWIHWPHYQVFTTSNIGLFPVNTCRRNGLRYLVMGSDARWHQVERGRHTGDGCPTQRLCWPVTSVSNNDWHCLANAPASSPWMFITRKGLMLTDITVHDQISQAFPTATVSDQILELGSKGLGTRPAVVTSFVMVIPPFSTQQSMNYR